jgi:hypothetical protein
MRIIDGSAAQREQRTRKSLIINEIISQFV